MNFTYQSGSNTATGGTALGTSGQDILVKKIIVGVPVGSGNIYLYNKSVAYSGDTDSIAFKFTFPATLTTSYQYAYSTVFEFSGGNNPGLQLDGGLLMIDQTMQVTVLWEPVGSVGGGA